MKKDGTCEKCADDCEECSMFGCKKCLDTGKYPLNGKCQSGRNYYDAGNNTCKKCKSDCTTCENGDKCLTCSNSSKIVNKDGECVCSKYKNYPNGNSCSGCKS